MKEFFETPEDRVEEAHLEGEAVRAMGHGLNPYTTGSPEAAAWDRGRQGLPLQPTDNEVIP